MFCSNCGSANEDGAKFCQKCGHSLAAEAPAAAAPPPPPPDTRMRDSQVAASVGGQTVTGKNPVLAAVLSIIPGVGQFYNGDVKKGALILGITIVSSFTIPIVGLAMFIWAIIDAYRVADGKAKTW